MRTISKSTATRPGRTARCVILGAVISAMFLGRAASGSQSVTLAWNASAGAAGYYFYYGTNSSAYAAQFDTGTNTMITLNGLCEGKTNYFSVAGYNSARMLGTPAAQVSFIVPGCVRLAAATQPGTPPDISFPVAVGHSYQVQASTNLQTWTTIWQTSVSTSNAWVSYQDPQAGGFARRFYRLILN